MLLESEFLYRVELGSGETDKHGRYRLSPHEASFAISYALGDRGPDTALLTAAASGKLLTREDYKKEVTRLLDDDNYFRGAIGHSWGSRDKNTTQNHFSSKAGPFFPRVLRLSRSPESIQRSQTQWWFLPESRTWKQSNSGPFVNEGGSSRCGNC